MTQNSAENSVLEPLPASVRRVQAALSAAGLRQAPLMLSDAARTAQQAADALGIGVGQIAKSIIFKRESDGAHVLVVTSGDKRVDTAKVAAIVGSIGRADAAFVRERSGYAIGGVPPVAHEHAPVVLLDAQLRRFGTIWAAAGHPHAVFELSCGQLQALTQADWADVTES
jgi:prolyl-tRNA editing enzyme YbaK/EbsC (Cys-tRNA(Pro) deacylase)